MFEEVVRGSVAPSLGARLLDTPAGPELAALLAGTDPASLSPTELSEALGAARRLESWTQSVCARMLEATRVAAVRQADDPAAEVGAVWGVSAQTAARLVNDAALVCSAPGTLAALQSGRLGTRQMARLLDVVSVLDPQRAAAVADRVCAEPGLDVFSVARMARTAARAVLEADPAAGEQRRAEALNRRAVRLRPLPDGMADLTVYCPAPAAAAALTSLSAAAVAAQRAGDDRSLDHLRVQLALTRLVPVAAAEPETAAGGSVAALGVDEGTGQVLPSGLLPGGVEVAVRVTVPLVTLAGAEDAPGALDGYGPISAALARELAAQSEVWTRILTDPATGLPCRHEQTRYRIPDAVRAFVYSRDPRCIHPGCNAPAEMCDIDHANPWPCGPTCACNLAPRCRRHHNDKTHGRWRVMLREDARHLSIAPSGRAYPVIPEPPPGPLPAESLPVGPLPVTSRPAESPPTPRSDRVPSWAEITDPFDPGSGDDLADRLEAEAYEEMRREVEVWLPFLDERQSEQEGPHLDDAEWAALCGV